MMDSELERNKRGTAESVIDSLIASGAVDAHARGDLIMRKRQKLIGYFSVCFFKRRIQDLPLRLRISKNFL